MSYFNWNFKVKNFLKSLFLSFLFLFNIHQLQATVNFSALDCLKILVKVVSPKKDTDKKARFAPLEVPEIKALEKSAENSERAPERVIFSPLELQAFQNRNAVESVAIDHAPTNKPQTNSGGMGVVERGFIPQRREAVAIKRAKNDSTEDNLQREIKTLQKLNSGETPPSEIPRYYGNSVNKDWQTELYTDWVEGKTFLNAHKLPLKLNQYVGGSKEVLRQLQSLLRALDWMHNKGVLHLDVKGANVMLRENGSLKLLDYGTAAEFDTIKGGGLLEPAFGYTETYASPEYRALFAEQIKKMKANNEPISTDLVGPKSDIYSVGVMIQFWLKKQFDPKTNTWPKDMPESIQAQYLILADIASRMTEFSVAKRMGAIEAIQELGFVAQSLK